MDTNNQEYQAALAELFAAVMKVLRLSGASCLTNEAKRQETVQRMMALLLEMGTNITNSTNVITCEHTPKSTNPTISAPNQEAPIPTTEITSKSLVGKRYATIPEEDEGQYFFRRTVENSKDESRFYAINIYSDGSCTFTMKDDVKGQEKMQILVDNKENLLNDRVVQYSGIPNVNSNIDTVEVGEAQRKGKSFLITKPLKIKFI